MSRTFVALFALIVLLVQAATPVTASVHDPAARSQLSSFDSQEAEGDDEAHAAPTGERRDGLNSVVIWTMVGVGIVAVVLGVFYFFKREVGAFPKDPTWVAPITIMASKDFPDDGAYGDGLPAAHGPTGH